MDPVGGAAGSAASATGMSQPSTKADDPFAGADTGEVGGSEFGSGAEGGGADAVDLSSVAGGSEVGDDALAEDGGASSYDSDGGLDDMGGGASEIDAMI
ncbi:hypothetical protein LRD18_04530 [Halorhodospira halochloris]|uniref:Uncharacterized protein n=1 Tax=Halorhodospira halochloris TaxID=1052 RepID=A0A110B6X8_HALHR|nr:hypothetical protein [Halorhodospira halochloris]MBK1651513.1 hypothetical protein [Halorhodospira halochloris]MCG5530139.1 hypothetical protein [Halorhodospira halochloris]MCG5547997.1 hypothetical protein [Halorhodospira halochloris]BAU57223.1 hypothetical protein HH1059_05390 [Halorhodospira halochloris]